MPKLTRLSWIGIGKETTLGTAVVPTLWIPVTRPKVEDIPDYEKDESIQANPTMYRGVYLGYEDGDVEFDGRLYPEVIGPLLVASGYADSITGAGPSYTHTFKIPAAGTQPPSYTITTYNQLTSSGNVRQYPGAIIDQLDLIVDAKGSCKYTSKWKAWPSSTASKPTPTWVNTTPLMGWEMAPSIGGSAVSRLISSQLTLKSSTELPHTMNGVRTPYTTFAGPREADWKFKAICEDETDWLHLVNNDQPALSLPITSPYGSPAPVLTMIAAAAAFTKEPLDFTQKWVQLDADVTGFYNSGDGGPVQFTLVNGVATAY